MTDGSAAARPAPPLRGALAAPGDKSISHRALILGALLALTAWSVSLALQLKLDTDLERLVPIPGQQRPARSVPPLRLPIPTDPGAHALPPGFPRPPGGSPANRRPNSVNMSPIASTHSASPITMPARILPSRNSRAEMLDT